MSGVTEVTGGAAAGAAAEAIGANGAISSMFTTLLVAQIKNQDPLSPADPSQFVGQLTQLSQMEALQKLASQGTANASALSSLQLMGLGAQVGSLVQARVEQLELGSAPVALRFTLDSNAAQTTLVLRGSDGAERRIELGPRGLGDQAFTLDPGVQGLKPGRYTLQVENESRQAHPVEVVAELSNVRLTGDGGALLSLGGLAEVSPAALTQFKGRAAAPAP
jgi:flagellar basal-body rod modification protein FlgD